MNIRKLTSLGIVFFAGMFQSWADDPSTADNPDSIFNDPSVLTNPEPATIKTKQQDDFLQSSETRIGGKFIGSFVTSWDWNQGTPPGWQFPDASAFTPDVESDIWFDSRPQKDFRVFGKGALIYPFQGDQTSNYPMTGATSSNSPNVYVKELFAD